MFCLRFDKSKMSFSERLLIYTDGSCQPNPGPGGYGIVVVNHSEGEWHISGGEDNKTTNNRMELTAVIEALKFAHDFKRVKIVSDSTYVIKCAKGEWSRGSNSDLWREYEKVSKGKDIAWEWVKGHSGDKYNEIVDFLAKQEVKKK